VASAPATTVYPKIPSKAWAILRKRAAAAPSTKFSAATVAALLGMANADSARTNIVNHFRRVGLIDDEGALTERGNKWRIDATFAEACDEIINDVYPSDLSNLTDDNGNPNRQAVNTWFQHQGFGGSNARQMALTYVMIAGKAVPEAPAVGATTNGPKASNSGAKPRKERSTAVDSESGRRSVNPSITTQQGSVSSGPDVHLDIQIHIPADATVEQIDQIFASMAKHLYKN